MPSHLPRDDNDEPIPCMRLKPGGGQVIAATGISARNAAAFDPQTRILAVYATGPVWIAFGDASVEAVSGGHFFPAGVYYDMAIGGSRDGVHTPYIAVLAAAGNCTVYVSEKE